MIEHQEDWLSCDEWGSSYQQQVERYSGRFRHRPGN